MASLLIPSQISLFPTRLMIGSANALVSMLSLHHHNQLKTNHIFASTTIFSEEDYEDDINNSEGEGEDEEEKGEEMSIEMCTDADIDVDADVDADDTSVGECCVLPYDDGDNDVDNNNSFYVIDSTNTPKNEDFSYFTEEILVYIPVVSPILAFCTYGDTARIFALLIEFFHSMDINRNWIPVDGGAYQIKIITPAINGIVVPTISILFATLISSTITALTQRQLDVRTNLNMEASELRVLDQMVDSFPPSFERNKCRAYLMQYTSRLIAESRSNVVINSLEYTGSMDSEMNGFLATLNNLAVMPTGDNNNNNSDNCNDESNNSNRARPVEILLSESYAAVMRLNAARSTRISALQSTFPPSQYMILGAIGCSICLAFLMETNQELLIFLNALQLRILWTMLIGLMSTLGVLCYDLSDPFRGIYTIESAVEQLYIIRDALRASSGYEDIY
eukprot:CAMPEP_0170856330 /NCGR_PEP_ID=MMETSP0734-20130129/14524_1 /TAXON_ID=186038 /ORGANISM="Fragilariopsis kerguelensis, Strain L26-C5" /LENGTH=449 /DNA_ID=CAMNT_0011228139 /DNA_START=143 /DNA_END=1489 /DNA_ORIENTATION=+